MILGFPPWTRSNTFIESESVDFKFGAANEKANIVAVVYANGAIGAWDLITGEKLGHSKVEIVTTQTRASLIWKDDNILVARENSDTEWGKFWRLSEGEWGNYLAPPFELSANGYFLATTGNSQITIWQSDDLRPIQTLQLTGSTINSAGFIDGARKVYAVTDKSIEIWEKRRAESIWGLIEIYEFWLAMVLLIAFLIAVRIDLNEKIAQGKEHL